MFPYTVVRTRFILRVDHKLAQWRNSWSSMVEKIKTLGSPSSPLSLHTFVRQSVCLERLRETTDSLPKNHTQVLVVTRAQDGRHFCGCGCKTSSLHGNARQSTGPDSLCDRDDWIPSLRIRSWVHIPIISNWTTDVLLQRV